MQASMRRSAGYVERLGAVAADHRQGVDEDWFLTQGSPLKIVFSLPMPIENEKGELCKLQKFWKPRDPVIDSDARAIDNLTLILL